MFGRATITWALARIYFKQIGKMGYTNYKTNENDFSSVMQ